MKQSHKAVRIDRHEVVTLLVGTACWPRQQETQSMKKDPSQKFRGATGQAEVRMRSVKYTTRPDPRQK